MTGLRKRTKSESRHSLLFDGRQLLVATRMLMMTPWEGDHRRGQGKTLLRRGIHQNVPVAVAISALLPG